MTFPRLLFPHISRIFSALCLWLLLFALISFNVFLRLTKPLAYSDNVFQIFIHPFSAPAHENLAHSLWNSGARTLAGHETEIVTELSPVLGANTTAMAEKEKADIIYWQTITTRYPDYRDAYIQLASLLYREGNLTQTQAYLTKAQNLDPNNATVNRLVDFTSKLLE